MTESDIVRRRDVLAMDEALSKSRTQRYSYLLQIGDLRRKLESARRAQFWCFAFGFLWAHVTMGVVLWSKGFLLATWCAPGLLVDWSIPWWFCP